MAINWINVIARPSMMFCMMLGMFGALLSLADHNLGHTFGFLVGVLFCGHILGLTYR